MYCAFGKHTKDASQFKLKPDGSYYKACASCNAYQTEYRRKNKERIRENHDRFDTANPYYKKKLYIANPEKFRQYRNNFNKKQPDYYKNYYENNKEYWVKWAADNPVKSNLDRLIVKKICEGRTRDKRDGMPSNLTKNYVKDLLDQQNNLCYFCHKTMKLVDFKAYDPEQFTCDKIHNSLGHVEGNIVISCLFCNVSHQNWRLSAYPGNPTFC